MNLEVLRVGENEQADWRQVVSWVYAKQAPAPDAYPLDEGESRFVVRLDGAPAGASTVIDYNVARGTVDLRTGGVAGVATLPEFRRAGVADAMMRSLLGFMHEDGMALTALYGFRETYYRKFGYETSGWRYQIKCPQGRLPKVSSDLKVRQIDATQLDQLEPVYTAFIRARSGSPFRTPADWTHRMGKKTPMIYVIGDTPEAYLWVHLEEFWGDVNVGEIAWKSREGYEGCLSLLGSLCSNQSTVTWSEPPDSPFVSRFMDQGVTVTINRATMFRVIGVQEALFPFKSMEQLEFSFELIDPDCPWNNGRWKVDCGAYGTQVARAETADFSIGIGAFSQAVMGQPSLRQLADQGMVSVTNPKGLDAACRLLNPMPVVCMEFF